ncbi:surfeit locus protein 1-like isoform X2 [Lineus longissimus]|uniref:surfeit locus protein 1-like isoform X2 n=1 Tax=Lineus longissimus TaxID=88925 RepID=UPI00315DA6AC
MMSVSRILRTLSETARSRSRSQMPLLNGNLAKNFQTNWRRQMSIRLDVPKKSNFNENGYILLVIPLTTFCLGAWQVKRRKWKLNLISELEQRTRTPPVSFPVNSLDDLKDLEYCRVRVKGTFDHSKEVYIGPRSLMKSEEERGGGLMSTGGNSGYHVVTPFHVVDSDLTILVNRGWVPHGQVEPRKRRQGQVTDEQEFLAVVRHTEKRPPFGAHNEPNSTRWHHRDIEAISEYLQTSPIFLDAGKDSTVEGGPIGGQTRVTLRNEHLSYIFTWYSLCAATLYMWYSRYGKRLFRR